jgi:hypothetical protein
VGTTFVATVAEHNLNVGTRVLANKDLHYLQNDVDKTHPTWKKPGYFDFRNCKLETKGKLPDLLSPAGFYIHSVKQ